MKEKIFLPTELHKSIYNRRKNFSIKTNRLQPPIVLINFIFGGKYEYTL